jgi:hypothetical protein
MKISLVTDCVQTMVVLGKHTVVLDLVVTQDEVVCLTRRKRNQRTRLSVCDREECGRGGEGTV